MPSESTQQRAATGSKPKRWWWRVVLVSVAVIGIVVGSIGSWLLYLLYIWQTGKAEVARAVAETDALNPRWRWEDLLAQREPLDPAEDAWPIIAELARRYREHPSFLEVRRFRRGSVSHWFSHEAMLRPYYQLPARLALVLEGWEAGDPVLARLGLELSAYRRAGCALVTTQGLFGPFADEHHCAMYALRLLHEWYLRQLRHCEAEHLLRGCWVVLSSLEHYPTARAQWVSHELERLAVARLERHLALTELSEPTRRQLAQELGRRAAINRFLQAIRRDRVLCHDFYEKLVSGELFRHRFGYFHYPFPIPTWWESFYWPADFAVLLRYQNELEQFAQLPVTEQISSPETEQIYSDYPWWLSERDEPVPGSRWPVRFPGTTRLCDRYLNMWAACWVAGVRLQAARAGLAAEEFRLRYGRLPTSWDELVPEFLAEVPLDPFEGKPMRWLNTAEGIVIYSVGQDRKDDGGQVHDNRDVGFRLYHPQHRALPPTPTKP